MGAMAPPLVQKGGAILSFGPTFFALSMSKGKVGTDNSNYYIYWYFSYSNGFHMLTEAKHACPRNYILLTQKWWNYMKLRKWSWHKKASLCNQILCSAATCTYFTASDHYDASRFHLIHATRPWQQKQCSPDNEVGKVTPQCCFPHIATDWEPL